jgi:Flp pilus assembly protein TadG
MLATESRHCLLNDCAGTIGITFGLTSMVVMLIVGGAIDFGRAYAMRSVMQNYSDGAALDGVTMETADAALRLTATTNLLPPKLGRYNGTETVLLANWRTDVEYEVRAKAKFNTSFLRAMSGQLASLNVSTRSVARSHRMKVVAGDPTKIDLSYEAADYNQVWAYCFDPNWSSNGTRTSNEGTKFRTLTGNLAFATTVATNENRNGRSDFVLVADNGGSTIAFSMPTCREGETVSYMLFNSRNSRTSPSNWKKNHTTCGTALTQTGKSCYTWYTDAKPDANGALQHNGTSPHQLETVLCSDANCTQPLNGGTVPGNNQRNRIPQVAQQCEPGKFMYFGWEDRPPRNQGGDGSGAPYAAGTADPGGDRDYDDIRLIVSCPVQQKDELNVRLIE